MPKTKREGSGDHHNKDITIKTSHSNCKDTQQPSLNIPTTTNAARVWTTYHNSCFKVNIDNNKKRGDHNCTKNNQPATRITNLSGDNKNKTKYLPTLHTVPQQQQLRQTTTYQATATQLFGTATISSAPNCCDSSMNNTHYEYVGLQLQLQSSNTALKTGPTRSSQDA